MSSPGEPPILLPTTGTPAATDVVAHVVTDQSRQNRSTANQWGLYGSHRRALEQHIVPTARDTHRLCVVGAGNCNDLDLTFLVDSYREVHLVDIDPDALQAAVDRQGVGQSARIHRHAPVDLTGIAGQVGRWAVAQPHTTDVDNAIRHLAAGPALPLPMSTFDCVLSPCVLTQLISPARRALGDRHPRLPALRSAMRDGHLLSLARLLRPAGRLVVTIDLASSSVFDGLARVPVNDLPDLMTSLVRREKNYPGLDPASLTSAVRGSSFLRQTLNDPVFTPPWLWHLSLQRCFLVYAVTFERGRAG